MTVLCEPGAADGLAELVLSQTTSFGVRIHEARRRKLEREIFLLKGELAANRDQPAVTEDGVELELLANINNVADAKAAPPVAGPGD